MSPMRLRTALFTVVGLAPFATACRSPSDSKTKPSAVVSMTPEPLAMRDAESVTKDASPEPAPRRKWATYADPKAPLSYVVDGYCAQLMVRASKGGTFAWWGEGTGNIARVTDTGLADLTELSRGLPGAYSYGPVIASSTGELFVEANTGGRSSMSSAVYHRSEKGWTTVAETRLSDDAGFSIYQLIGAYGAGALATVSRCNGSCRAAGVVALGEPTPRIAWEGEAYGQAWVGEDKTVIIGAQRCDAVTPDKCACTARAFLPNGDVKPHAFDAEPCGLSIAGATSRDVFVANGAVLAQFDGSAWRRVPAPRGNSLRIEAVSSDGVAWVSNGSKLYRQRGGEWDDITPPGGLGDTTHGKRLDGVTFGEVWAVTPKGLVRTPADKIAWESVAIPLPPFAAITTPPGVAGVMVAAKGDAWVNVAYGTQFEGTSAVEPRRALLRTRPPTETMRCGGRAGREGVAALESWPPRATPECTTPAVVVAQAPLTKDAFPRTRSILKGHKELGESIELVEVKVAEPPYVVARAPSYNVGVKLATLVSKKVPFGIVPELVCAELEGASVRVDLATGEVSGDAAPTKAPVLAPAPSR